MQVKLRRSWFAPNAELYRAGVHTFPDKWKEFLPPTAEMETEDEKPTPTKPAKASSTSSSTKKPTTKLID